MIDVEQLEDLLGRKVSFFVGERCYHGLLVAAGEWLTLERRGVWSGPTTLGLRSSSVEAYEVSAL